MCFYIFLRIFGWLYLAQTKLWQIMISDKLHHYHFGLLLILGSVFFLRKLSELKAWLMAIGSGMVMDEAILIFVPVNPVVFSHYHAFYSLDKFLIGLLFEFRL